MIDSSLLVMLVIGAPSVAISFATYWLAVQASTKRTSELAMRQQIRMMRDEIERLHDELASYKERNP